MEQLELDLPEVPDNRIYFESTSVNADIILAQSIGKFRECFVIGVSDEGFYYAGSHGDATQWLYALERAKTYLMRMMD